MSLSPRVEVAARMVLARTDLASVVLVVAQVGSQARTTSARMERRVKGPRAGTASTPLPGLLLAQVVEVAQELVVGTELMA